MTVEIIGLVALLVGLLSLSFQPQFIIYAFMSTMLLGSAAAFILESLGGTSISPSHLLLGFLAIKLFTDENMVKRAVEGLSFPQPGFWLLVTVLYSTLTAYMMPRLFAGQTFIFPVRTTGYSLPLEPATSNLTQSIYLIGDFICFILIYAYAATLQGRRVLGNAALVCVVLNLVFAVIDLATYATGTTELLSIIRNATYSMLNETELAGFKRITGSFVEASSFGSATLGFFAFSSRLWLLGLRTRLTGPLAGLSLLALFFSTSTTAYVGLAGILTFFYMQTLIRALQRPVQQEAWLLLIGAPILFMIAVFCIALNDASAAWVQNLLDTTILNKMSTESGVERSMWNRQGMQNFYDTFGFGVGNGSMRASSFPIAALASIGIVGSLFLGSFLISVLFARGNGGFDRLDDGYREAAKSVCIAMLITATSSGAFIDLGLAFFAFAALACSKPAQVPAMIRQDAPLDMDPPPMLETRVRKMA